MLKAPYRFVPLSPFVLQPDWFKQVSHDHPFSDGLSGELELTITSHTDICAGGEQVKAAGKPGEVRFFRTPEGQPAIPATTLKGMLRAVLKPATFGHFEQVEDQRLGFRDISKSTTVYSDLIRSSKAGWLSFSDSKWVINPCLMTRVYQKDLIRHFQIDENAWKDASAAEERYRLLGGLRELSFSIDEKENADLGGADLDGILVVTGQPGPDYTKSKAKKKEFIFHKVDAKAIEVPVNVMNAFMQVHSESNDPSVGNAEWKYWKSKLEKRGDAGIPVFYHLKSDGSIRSLGLAYMYRLAYNLSLHAAIRNSNPNHLERAQPDFAELLLGRVDDVSVKGAVNLRGRVMLSNAEATHEVVLSLTDPSVLSSPKPSFYPAYIEQENNGRGKVKEGYQTLMDPDARLSGWKRYPARNNVSIAEMSEDVCSNSKVQVRIQTAPAGTTFRGRLRFHNLRLVELGALLWSLDFGGRRDCRHQLGAGKPFGFGQVSLVYKVSRFRPNGPVLQMQPERVADLAHCAFDAYMQHAWSSAVEGDCAKTRWDESPALSSLLVFADPDNACEEPLEYLILDDFMKAKQDGDVFAPYPGVKRAECAVHLHSGTVGLPSGTATVEELESNAQRLRIEMEDQKALENRAREDRKQKRLRKKELSIISGVPHDVACVCDAIDEVLAGQAASQTIVNNLVKDLLNLRLYKSAILADLQVQEQLKAALSKLARGGPLPKRLEKAAKSVVKALDLSL